VNDSSLGLQRLEATIGATRGKLEDAAPVVSTSNPQAHTLAGLTGADIDNVEIFLILLVALLVEMGGLGPFVTMNLAKVLRTTKLSAAQPIAQPAQTPLSESLPIQPPATSSPTPAHRQNLFSAATENLQSDIADVHAAHEVAKSSYRPAPNIKPRGASQHRNGAHAKRHVGVPVRPPHDYMKSEGPRA
jgi:hypothetical protein